MKKGPLLAGNHCFANLRTDKQVRMLEKGGYSAIRGYCHSLECVREKQRGPVCKSRDNAAVSPAASMSLLGTVDER